ncbi:CPBP family intramembrane glutamic endopeptidase [Thermogemmatispora sp.]|uniref:CPBP family intramembrane glutamic endopeptidase n=1 Tax=Thermogemmatispora sp. TaxID=1968838 RepID=UPI001D855C61|nr:CPBP family intramembrane glutamic endopeptidase [Thermogemmatispora sp.]MBX5450573.1 CPBP family intramembrane metalloprotease [Thermogemmatispora sp.]
MWHFTFPWLEFLVLSCAALVSVACATPYLLALNSRAFKQAQERLRRPLWVLLLLQGAQSAALLVVVIGLGLPIAHHLGLGAPLLEGLLAGRSVTAQAEALIGPALLLGLGPAALLLGVEILVFWPRLPEAMRTALPIPPLWKRFLACFYGGIAEELICRLFLLSLFAWLLAFIWRLPGGEPAPGAFWLAAVMAALLFGLGHLPATAALTRLTPLLIGRAMLLNGVAGVAFAYLYWRYGLEAAMLGHFCADLVFHILGDSIAKLLRAARVEKPPALLS